MRAWWGKSTGQAASGQGIAVSRPAALNLLASIGRVRPVEGSETRRQLRQLAARHGVIRQTQADGIRPVEAGPGEAEPEPEPPRHAAQNQLAPTSG